MAWADTPHGPGRPCMRPFSKATFQRELNFILLNAYALEGILEVFWEVEFTDEFGSWWETLTPIGLEG